jgi:FMN phosphatase YigB (HAD superfamily)
MKKYQWFLFDADNTLFHFDDFEGLKRMLSHLNVIFTEQDYQEYQIINKPLWLECQQHKITADELQQRRFTDWGKKTGIATKELNNRFLTAMAETCPPLEGAQSLLQMLKNNNKKVGIITNGFIALHQIRLDYMGLNQFIDLLVVSEEVGIARIEKFLTMRSPAWASRIAKMY